MQIGGLYLVEIGGLVGIVEIGGIYYAEIGGSDDQLLSIVVYDVLRRGALHLFVHCIHFTLYISSCLVAHFHTHHHLTTLA